MFRKRRLFQVDPLGADQLAELVRANQLQSEGKPQQAAALFAQLAQAMLRSNHPRRAANLYARAAHAFADANDAQAAMENSKLALTLFTQSRMAGRAAAFYTNITRKLSTHRMAAAADELTRMYGATVAAAQAAEPRRAMRGMLPSNCPKCGAPLHSEELSWLDDNTIECDYCGASIRTE